MCEDRLITVVLVFIWLCFALKYCHMPLVLFAPLAGIAFFVVLNAACKLYDLWK